MTCSYRERLDCNHNENLMLVLWLLQANAELVRWVAVNVRGKAVPVLLEFTLDDRNNRVRGDEYTNRTADTCWSGVSVWVLQRASIWHLTRCGQEPLGPSLPLVEHAAQHRGRSHEPADDRWPALVGA